MTAWIDRILKEFPDDLARLWIVADPDDILLDQQVLSGLRERSFEVLPFEDTVDDIIHGAVLGNAPVRSTRHR